MMPNKALHRTAKSGAPIVALLFAAGELDRWASQPLASVESFS